MIGRAARTGLGLALGGLTALGHLLLIVPAAVLLLPPARPAGACAARWLAKAERIRVAALLGGQDSTAQPSLRRVLRYLAARLPVGLLGAAVLMLLGIGAVFGTTMLWSWMTRTPWMLEQEPAIVVSTTLVAYYALPGAVLLYLGLAGAAGIARWERSLLARLLAPSREEQLTRRVAELSRTRDAVVAAVDDERRRIERDLHDGVQQRLVALGMLLGRARRHPDRATEFVAQAHEETQRALADLRDVSWRGYPGAGHRGPRHRTGVRGRAGTAAGADHVRAAGRAAAGTAGGGVVRRLRGSDERGQALGGAAGGGGGADGREPAADERPRRRPGRRRSVRWRPERPGPAGAGGRRHAHRHQPAGQRHDDHRGAAVRVTIAEDSALLREGLVRLLVDEGHEVVAAVGDARALLGAVEKDPPDVVVADVRMPPTHSDEGIVAALEIRRRWPDVGVLVLSQYVERRHTAQLVGGPGARVGYLLKDRVAQVGEFLDALDRIGAGGAAFDPEVVRQLLAHGNHADPLARLTPRERDVLDAMAEGLTNAGISDRLRMSVSAVEKHVASIFGKLGIPETAGYSRRVLAVLRYLGS